VAFTSHHQAVQNDEHRQQAFIITKKYHNIPTVNAGSFPHSLKVYKMCIRKMLD